MVQCILVFFENGSKQTLEGAMGTSKLPCQSCCLRLGSEGVRRIDIDEFHKPRKFGHEHTCRTRHSEENGSRHNPSADGDLTKLLKMPMDCSPTLVLMPRRPTSITTTDPPANSADQGILQPSLDVANWTFFDLSYAPTCLTLVKHFQSVEMFAISIQENN